MNDCRTKNWLTRSVWKHIPSVAYFFLSYSILNEKMRGSLCRRLRHLPSIAKGWRTKLLFLPFTAFARSWWKSWMCAWNQRDRIFADYETQNVINWFVALSVWQSLRAAVVFEWQHISRSTQFFQLLAQILLRGKGWNENVFIYIRMQRIIAVYFQVRCFIPETQLKPTWKWPSV